MSGLRVPGLGRGRRGKFPGLEAAGLSHCVGSEEALGPGSRIDGPQAGVSRRSGERAVEAEEPLQPVGDQLHGVHVGAACPLVAAQEPQVAGPLERASAAERAREVARIQEAMVHPLARKRKARRGPSPIRTAPGTAMRERG